MVLIRTVIGRKLAEYYSQPGSLVVGKIDPSTIASIPLSALWGEWHWQRQYQRFYEQQVGQWLTPVELFRPYYSQIFAEFIVRHNQHHTYPSTQETQDNALIEIVELGGGHGTHACIVLDYLQQSARHIYDRVISYTMIDSSPTLHEKQKELLLVHHADKMVFIQKDLTQVAEGRVNLLPERSTFTNPYPHRTCVMAMELFDNLPHDKIRVHSGVVQEGHVCTLATTSKANNHEDIMVQDILDYHDQLNQQDDSYHNLEEIFIPITDPLLKNVLHKMGSTYFTRQRARCSWVPSVGLGLIQQLLVERPAAQLVIADFDSLPSPDRLSDRSRKSGHADGEPIITSMDDCDHPCYITAPKFCDILFPTNFRDLAHFTRKVVTRPNSEVTVMKQADFLQSYGSHIIPKTKSWLTGYTPLIQDFQNYSILTITDRVVTH